ncbi:hypothetical protein HT102_03340 [Hoyosella sp. G463]|uniref:Uncharacterized protein n=1 Tax=Lolliginicoccus lacisalsi TaxID=2742202 RepID=A0A927JAE1_9ACTN|nr:hypothetical protein [Lolliginicoccus lacisalsi]MBD8505525.1 hypothetical protein [Lolliginicoccus lacisalsi]
MTDRIAARALEILATSSTPMPARSALVRALAEAAGEHNTLPEHITRMTDPQENP